MSRRPDPRRHQRADLWLGWDDPALRTRRAAGRRERAWWALVGFFAAFALFMAARLLEAIAAGRLG